ncbi:7025_t:CDS:2 [Rhizophagus irregularis]|nr:7025_t:CDS:2 [Rhizophagus irregularis]
MWFVQLPILKASGDSDQRMTKIEHYIFGEKAHLSSTSSHPPPIPPSSPPIQSPFPNYILSQHLLDDSQIEMGFMDLSTFPLLLQVMSTNSLESFHSELKKITSSLHGLIGAVHGIVNIDCKKRSKAESASFDFRIKKVSTYGVDDDILKRKGVPGLTSLNCFCLFHHRYLLPCKHIFHKHMYGNKLLTAEVWKMFHQMFEEKYVQTEQQKGAESQKIAVGELTKRMCDRYWHVEEMGDVERMQSFISMLEAFVDLIISRFDNNSSGKT